VHHGRVIKRTGDGALIEFRSVVDAVRCAVEASACGLRMPARLPTAVVVLIARHGGPARANLFCNSRHPKGCWLGKAAHFPCGSKRAGAAHACSTSADAVAATGFCLSSRIAP
jgi:class 3 adenylate cyclase